MFDLGSSFRLDVMVVLLIYMGSLISDACNQSTVLVTSTLVHFPDNYQLLGCHLPKRSDVSFYPISLYFIHVYQIQFKLFILIKCNCFRTHDMDNNVDLSRLSGKSQWPADEEFLRAWMFYLAFSFIFRDSTVLMRKAYSKLLVSATGQGQSARMVFCFERCSFQSGRT